MCGITGIYNFNSEMPVEKSLIQRMTDVLAHRGPDGSGVYLGDKTNNGTPRLGLGHRRLAIIDLNTGNQPLANEDNTVWIVFNGEIYNFVELKEDLIRKGHRFKTLSDTEVIVHLYEEYKEDCVKYPRGMFAFALWDEKAKKLLLARDRIGKKPLYYLYDGKRFIFGSEIKAILQVPGVDKKIDYQALDDFFTFQSIAAPKTIFKSIRKIYPGHLLVCTPRGIEEREYWDLDFSKVGRQSEAYFTDKLEEIIKDSVRCRLRSDVPLGAFLSGGIDSSIVVMLMSELLGSPIITSSIGFEEEKFNELEFARVVAKKIGAVYHEHTVKPEALDIINRIIGYFDEPFADASAIPTYYVSQLTRNHVKVALSGDGGDESFAGYRRYYYDRLENRFRIIPAWLRKSIIGGIANMYPQADWLPQILRGKTLLTNLSLSSERGYMNTRSTFKYGLKDQLYSQALKKNIGNYDPFSVLDYYFHKARTDDPLSRIQYVDIKTYLADDILTKVDRMSMANSLEVRSPLLDHNVIEFSATIPSTLKLKGATTKYVLKKCFEKKIPPQILNRKKMGFSVPIETWLRTEIKGFSEEILFDQNSRYGQYFNVDSIKRIWSEHLTGKRNYSTQLWCLLIFELWHRKYLN